MSTTMLAPDIEKLVQNADPRHSVAEAKGNREAVMEPKLDGWRIIAITDEQGKVRTYSRKGIEYTGKMPAIEAELERVLPPDSILDGEVVAFTLEDGALVHKWGTVQSILGSGTAKAALMSGKLTFVVFDLLRHGGHDARSLPYSTRRTLLEKLFELAEFDDRIQLIPQMEATDENYDALIAAGYEGAMVKHVDAAYASGIRGKGWFKLKASARVDVVIVGYKPGTPGSSFDGMVGAIEFGQYDENGILVHRGRCSGMDFILRKKISDNQDAYLGQVMEIAHMGVFAPEPGKTHGAFRHPQFKRLRPDKSAEAVTLHDE